MFLNPGKCHYLVINKDIPNEFIELGEKILPSEGEQKLLGIKIDKDLNFQSHAKSIIKTANKKLSALIRVAPFFVDFPLLKDSSIIVHYSGRLALEL